MEIVISRDDYGFIRILIFKSRSHGHKIPRVESRDGRMTYGIRNASCRGVALSYHDGRGGTQGVHAAHRVETSFLAAVFGESLCTVFLNILHGPQLSICVNSRDASRFSICGPKNSSSGSQSFPVQIRSRHVLFHPGELPGHTFCRFFMFEKQLFGPFLLFSGAFGLEGCFILLAYKSPLRFPTHLFSRPIILHVPRWPPIHISDIEP